MIEGVMNLHVTTVIIQASRDAGSEPAKYDEEKGHQGFILMLRDQSFSDAGRGLACKMEAAYKRISLKIDLI